MASPKPAPLDIVSRFLKAVKSKQYQAALTMSDDILSFEPNNSVILAYRPYLSQMAAEKNEESDGNATVESEGDSEDTEESDEESEAD